MVEEGASERFIGIFIDGRDSINRKNLLNDIKSKF